MKRCLFKIALFLLFGAIVNVAVALACSFWILKYPSGKLQFVSSNSDHKYAVFSLRAFGSERIAPVTKNLQDMYLDLGTTSEEVELSSFDWSILRTDETSQYRIDFEVARGWPMLCIYYYSEWQGIRFGKVIVRNPTFVTVMQAGDTSYGYQSRRGRIIPFTPIWWGLTINSFFYALVLWLLWSSPFTARRMIRRKRGCCLKCGYDLRGTAHEVCPECGCELIAKAKP